MKPFMGIDLSIDKKNDKVNGEEFLVAAPSAMVADAFAHAAVKAAEKEAESKLPVPMRIIQAISGWIGAIMAFSLFRALMQNPEVSFEKLYSNAPALIWVTVGLLAIWMILKIMSTNKKNQVLKTDDSEYIFANFESNCDAVYEDLGVPKNAVEVDVLSFYYKDKDGKLKIYEKGFEYSQYKNLIFKIFADAQTLYLANLDGKYAFSKESIVKVHTQKKNIRIASWNKELLFNKEPYKKYKITTDQYGGVHCKAYHIIEINHMGQSYGIYIPDYELPVFEHYMK